MTGAERVPAVDATDVGHGGAPRCSAVSAINGAAGGGSADEAVGRGPAPPDVPEQVQYPSEKLTFHSPSANISRIYSFPGIRAVLDPSSKNCPSLSNMVTSWVPSTDVA